MLAGVPRDKLNLEGWSLMALVSYAQNQEDIMLWRALRHVRDGFYIDVGAADPDDLSVSKTFYDLGWRGINVEPNGRYFATLCKARPRDINLRVGVGREAGSEIFFNVIGTGLSTFDRDVAMDHRARGYDVVEQTFEMTTLAEICRQHRPAGPIHFLKIDVEGTEGDVLAGADFAAFRPWIVLVEATVPLSQATSCAGWEPLLTGQGFCFVWFDGLNRFYLSEEMTGELREHFRVQPNIFDNFVPLPELRRRVEQAEQGLQAARAEVMHTVQLAAETLQCATLVSEQSAEAVRRVTEVVAQQSALIVDVQRRNADAIHRWDALAQGLTEIQARHAALSGVHEDLHAALDRARAISRGHEELLLQIRRSTSWRVTAPLRVVRRLLAGAPDSLSRRSIAKELARRVFRRSILLLLWMPGGRFVLRLARTIAPRPVEWLALRYRSYEQSAVQRREGLVTRSPAPAELPVVPPTTQTSELVRSLSTDESRMLDAELGQEEASIYLQLSTRYSATTVFG